MQQKKVMYYYLLYKLYACEIINKLRAAKWTKVKFSRLLLLMLRRPHSKDSLSPSMHMEKLCHQSGKRRQLLMTELDKA